MKRFWLVLLSLGLVMAFSVSAFAVDVKVSGEYYAAGLYLDKTTLNKDAIMTKAAVPATLEVAGTPEKSYQDYRAAKPFQPAQYTYPGPSTAFFFQRLRVGTDFIVSPCLKLVTRFDALERVWGGARSNTGTALAIDSAGTRAENENIAFDYAYIVYDSPIGQFKVGMMPFGTTGTVFADSNTPKTTIKYGYTTGPATIYVGYTKITDNSDSAVTTSPNVTDADQDYYAIEGVYAFKDGKAGMKVSHYRYADKRPTDGYKKTYFNFTPYAIAKIGPVDVQGEINWAYGSANKYDNSTPADIDLNTLSVFLDATANLGIAYVGGTIAYLSGDDPNTTTKIEGGTNNGGIDWNPCLILFNADVTGLSWAGTIPGYNASSINGPMTNAWFGQGRVGVKPIPQLDAMMSVSYAAADQIPKDFNNRSYGWEVDVTGTYKITNNLSYMLGVGYLFTGDYFKGKCNQCGADNKVNDDYMLINKLTLNF